MRAVTQLSFGTPDVLVPTEAARPVPGPGEVLVRVRAASVNPVDAHVRAGTLPMLGEPPFVLGWDVSGVVEEVAPDVTRFEVGDEVFGMPCFPRPAGAYAEYVAAPAGHLVRKPAALDHVRAAALPLAGLTAWQALVGTAGLREGMRVLVHGAGGGVGHLAVQIAKARGAEVLATASAAKHDLLRSLGADRVIDYRTGDFAAGLDGIDVVLDGVGGYGPRSLPVLAEDGVLITLIERNSPELAAAAAAAGRRLAGPVVEPDAAGLTALAALVEQGLLRPYVQHVLPLEEAAKAHGLIGSRATPGKIVLTV
ncbi:NADP-dependent oxidoreductase [Streptomyces sp. NRRL B-24484]|uniref:NADP-dependent oxidoreductase n=1 Tax=Streptomyces sp. NRRL B-24484 TaxID=1463833 RepID=UPI0004C189AD|nr:NADP-dependent oxidoreductase [Streptomyces sp. NRRL B-24484]